MQKLRIFTASASDMATECARVETVAALLKPLADNLGIVLEVIDWRLVVPRAGRPQQVIFDQLKPTEWDVFIGIIWHRFGRPPGGTDPLTQKEYQAGTEEEFKTAYTLWKQHDRPRIMVYRCTRAIPPEALDPEQFMRVKEFFAQFDAVKGEHPGLYQSFETPEAFEKLLLGNLQTLLLEYGERTTGKPIAQDVIETLAPQIPDNLPRRASFFGRDKEMEIVLRALSPEDHTWGVLVDGIGGIGKTALAIEAAYRCKEKGLFEAFIFVSAKQNLLAPGSIREMPPDVRTLDEFLNETARVLGQEGITKLAGDVKRRALLDALRETPALLVYDNLETLTKEKQEALADFLRAVPTACKAIITSRRRGGEGAVWLRLEKLEWEAARQLIAEEAKKDARLSEKLRRAGEARWQELYDATGGSPLALAHTLGLMRVRAALTFDGALEMLRGNRDTNLQKFIYQEARREWTTNDRTALRALSFFAPSATFEAWMEVAQLSRKALETTIDRLSALSLVDVMVSEDRYALHPLTRNFVRDELLSDAQTERATGMQFVKYWLAYARRYGELPENYRTFNLIEAEWENLEAVAEWLWQTAGVQDEKVRDRETAMMFTDLTVALCDGGGPLYYLGRWDEGLKLNERAYEAERLLKNWARAGWRAFGAAWIHNARRDTDKIAHWTECCFRMWERGGSRDEQAIVLYLRGALAQERKDYDAAAQFFQEALAIRRRLGTDIRVGVALYNLAVLERLRKHYAAAEKYHHEALKLFIALDGKQGIASQYRGLGDIALDCERWAEARQWFEKALPVAREIGQQSLISTIQYRLARAHEQEGRLDLALPPAQEALAIEQKLHRPDVKKKRELVERLEKKIAEQSPDQPHAADTRLQTGIDEKGKAPRKSGKPRK